MLTINFSPFPTLETTRLVLRKLNLTDADAMFALRSDPNVMQFVPRSLAKTRKDAVDHIALINSKIESNEGINWAITLKESDAMIGIIGHYRIEPENFRAEIGYMILPEHSGKGYITEAIHELSVYGFEVMKLHSIAAVIDPENIASERVLLKNQFVKEAHLKENEYYNGQFLDTVIYSLLNKNFKKNSDATN